MRRFEFRDGKSAKFWAVELEGNALRTSWGKIGTGGRTQVKEFGGDAAAAREAEKQIAVKISKGYAEVGIAPASMNEPTERLSPGDIPREVPPVSFALESAAGRGLVLGIASDGDHVVAVGGQGLDLFLSSLDGGKTFTPRRSPGPGLRGAFVRGNDVWVCGEWGHIAHSPDRAESWTVISSRRSGCLFGIVADRHGTLWVAGDDGFLASSSDGRTFEKVPGITAPIGRIAAGPMGVYVPTDSGQVYLATPEGVEDLGVRAPGDLMKTTVTPCGTAVVVGDDAIYRAVDGRNFEKVEGEHYGLLCGVAAFEDGRVVVVGESGQIWLSFDDAVSFERVAHSLSSSYLWCAERVYDTVLVGAENGKVLRIGLPAERAPSPLPPLPAELSADAVVPDNPLWVAPPPSDAAQTWIAPSFDTELRDGIFFTPKLRSMLFPRRGGIDVGVRPLPTLDEAWGAFRRAVWASDGAFMEARHERSRIWGLVTSTSALDRAVGERLLDPEPRAVCREEDAHLVERVMSRDRGLVYDFAEQVYERLTDLWVCTNGLVEGLGRVFTSIDTLPGYGVGPFGRFRELLAVTDDATYEAARDVVIGEIRSGESAARRWAATFMFPLGPEAGPAERELHEAAMSHVGHIGSSRAHPAGIAAGGLATLERFIGAQIDPGADSQFFGPFTKRMYLTSVLELEGSAACEIFTRLKPKLPHANDAFFNAFWCSLLAHIDSELALEAMYREYQSPPGDSWAAVSFAESATISPDRVLDFVRARGATDLRERIENDVKFLLTQQVPVDPEDAALFGVIARPGRYEPPPTTHVRAQPMEWAPPPVFDWDDELLTEAINERPPADFARWNGVPLERCSPKELEEFVSHRERWALPTTAELLAGAPRACLERLRGIGFDLDAWGTARFLPTVLMRGGSLDVPLLVAAIEHDFETGFETAQSVGDARLAPAIATAFAGKKYKGEAASWLLRFPRHAAAGGVQMIAENPSDTQAQRLLRFVAARGHRAAIVGYSEHAGISDVIREVLDADPLTDVVRRKLKIPSWAAAAVLPVLQRADGTSATADEVDEEVARLAMSNPLEPHPLVPSAHERWTRESLGELAWAVFEAWLAGGGDAKQQWALQAVGFFGDDEAARQLTALARAWPGKGYGKRAQWAIDALANIGSDVALANINLLAEKSRFPAFKDAAAWQIRNIAADRGMTPDELADRLVPKLDLEGGSAATLDYGTRTFQIQFDETLMPRLCDEDGKVHKNPPRPRKSDDEGLANAEISRFRVLKRAAKTAASLQITRMERTMRAQRPIDIAVFREHFVAHPWMTHLARRLVWCVAAEPSETFRIADDGTLADVTDELFHVPAGSAVTVAHPLHFADSVAADWEQLFADYELAQPFEQLGRPVFVLQDGEFDLTELFLFWGKTTDLPRLRGLEVRGWRRWMEDSEVSGMSRTVAPGVRAVLRFEPGWYPGDFAADVEEQTLQQIHIYAADEVTLGDLSPVAFSELVHDITRAIT